jgi:hypothetical protein
MWIARGAIPPSAKAPDKIPAGPPTIILLAATSVMGPAWLRDPHTFDSKLEDFGTIWSAARWI